MGCSRHKYALIIFNGGTNSQMELNPVISSMHLDELALDCHSAMMVNAVSQRWKRGRSPGSYCVVLHRRAAVTMIT